MTFCFQYNLLPPADLLFTLWCRVRRHKVVLCAHDILPLEQKFYHKFLYALLYRAVNKLMVFARVNMERVISELGVDARKVELKPLGNFLQPARKTESRREARESLGLSEDDRVVLFFGQIKRSKGLDHLIRAFAEVIQSEPRAMLVIAGRPQGVELSIFTDLIREYSLEDRVVLDARYIPDEEIPRYFASADLVALPYTELYQSAVLMLACSHGTPVVASNVGGMSEVISDGTTGYLVPPGDEKELAAAIVKAFRNPEESQKMGREARRLMEQKFSWDRYLRELEEALVRA
jgi:glycosyltransferase involved in cell wall biosynthesis